MKKYYKYIVPLVIVGLIILLQPREAYATFTEVQGVTNNTNCSVSSGTTCALTVTSTTAGDVGVLITTVSSGSASVPTDNKGSTWSSPVSCESSGTSDIIDVFYTLNLKSAVTSVSATVGSNVGRNAAFYEFSSTGSPTFDVCGTVSNASATASPGVALTLTGTNDFIVQAFRSDGGNTSAVSGAYSSTYLSPAGQLFRAYAYVINSTNGTAPTWTHAPAGTSHGSAIAIYDAKASSGPVHKFVINGNHSVILNGKDKYVFN